MNLRRQLHLKPTLLFELLLVINLTIGAQAVISANDLISSVAARSESSMVFGAVDVGDISNNMSPPEYRPPQVPLDVEGYPNPPDLKLEQVHMYVRHGERTPVRVRLSQPPASIPEHWLMCNMARQFQAAAFGISERNGIIHKRVEHADGTVLDGECLLGELTDTGRQSTYHLGRGLRNLYVERLRFLPDFLNNTDEVYFRSTNVPRTIESLQQIIHGLYPTAKCKSDVSPTILVRNGLDEDLCGNTDACKRLENLMIKFARAAATTYNPSLEQLDVAISKYIQGNPVRVNGKPRASGIMDTIRAAIAHGVPVPAEFKDKAIVDTIEKAVISEWFADETEEVRRLGMGPLLGNLVNKMQRKLDLGDRDPLKIRIHSTHDTTLAALCATLDVFDNQWPAFTAAITFELFRKTEDQCISTNVQAKFFPFTKASAPEHYVRVRYQNKNLALPLCADKGKHLPGSPEFCTFTAFRERVKDLTPADWDKECSPTE